MAVFNIFLKGISRKHPDVLKSGNLCILNAKVSHRAGVNISEKTLKIGHAVNIQVAYLMVLSIVVSSEG